MSNVTAEENSRWKCSIGNHDWGKWGQGYRETKTTRWLFFTFESYYRVQHRTCEFCGIEESKVREIM